MADRRAELRAEKSCGFLKGDGLSVYLTRNQTAIHVKPAELTIRSSPFAAPLILKISLYGN
jgi:hypothetical protein